MGAVVLTNADPGWILRTQFRRKLLEVLFDGKPEADAQVAAQGKTFYEELAAERKLMTVPADAAEGAKLAPQYTNPALGEIAVSAPRRHDGLRLRRVEERDGVAQEPRRHGLVPDHGARDRGLRVRRRLRAEKKTLVIRDAQHEYVFEAK